VALLVLLAVVWLWRRLWPRWAAWTAAQQHAMATSEQALFAAVVHSSRDGDGLATDAALRAWVRRLGEPSLASWCSATGDTGLQREVEALEHALFATPSPAGWDANAFRSAVTGARRAWLARSAATVVRPPALPSLN